MTQLRNNLQIGTLKIREFSFRHIGFFRENDRSSSNAECGPWGFFLCGGTVNAEETKRERLKSASRLRLKKRNVFETSLKDRST